MSKEKDYFKFPIYWSDFFMNLSDKQAGRLLKSVLKYAFYGEYPDFSKFNKEQKDAWYIMKRDLDFQKEHSRAYRYIEDYQDDVKIIRRSGAYANWRKTVFERDDYTCQVCGQVCGKLNAHHIRRFADYPELRLEVTNGITLCEDCHRKLHRKEITLVIVEE